MVKETTQLIDIEKVINNKDPRLLKVLPGFLIRYLKRIIHQEELNTFLSEHGHLEGLPFIRAALEMLEIKYHVIGKENIPKNGRFIFVSNHPLGGLDGLVFIQEVGTLFPDIKFPVNDLLLNIYNLNNIFLPVNKHGAQSRVAARAIEDAYASESQILNFPAGLCSRKHSGVIMDIEWKKHFISKAVTYERDILPVFFSGRNSGFFYNLSNLRVFLGIKSNFEMIYLPHEMFKQKGKELTLIFGKPISYTLFDKSRTPVQWADYVKKVVYNLGEKHKAALNI
ncbi:MAG: glycerol acyltransferase [Chlorobi bacterium]|nr:glycerol acyltransferase [Chlorobiota bacterium]